MKDFVLKIFKSHSGVSSKRVFGGLGFLISLGVLIYCTIMVIQAPIMIDMVLICSMSLLGIDSVTGMFNGKHRRNNFTEQQIVEEE